MSKINITNIVIAHFKTQFTVKSDYFLFLIMPMLLSSLTVYYGINIEGQINTIISSLSIFIGLFINVLVLLFDMLRRSKSRPLKTEGLKELLSNISFSILISGLTIGLFLGTKFENKLVNISFKFLAVFFLIWLFLIILMILKRIFILFTDEANQIEKEKKKEDNLSKKD